MNVNRKYKIEIIQTFESTMQSDPSVYKILISYFFPKVIKKCVLVNLSIRIISVTKLDNSDNNHQ